jgi:hypothetical protein
MKVELRDVLAQRDGYPLYLAPDGALLDRDAYLVGEDAHHLGRDLKCARQAIGLGRDANTRMTVEQEIVPPCDQRG